MRDEKYFVEKELPHTNAQSSLEHFLSNTATPKKQRSLEIEYLLRNGKYTMKEPFYNFQASKRYFDKAMVLDSSNWEIWINLATLSFFDNRTEEGRNQLEMAIKLKGEPIDQDDRGSGDPEDIPRIAPSSSNHVGQGD